MDCERPKSSSEKAETPRNATRNRTSLSGQFEQQHQQQQPQMATSSMPTTNNQLPATSYQLPADKIAHTGGRHKCVAQAIFKSIYMQQSIFFVQIVDPGRSPKPKPKNAHTHTQLLKQKPQNLYTIFNLSIMMAARLGFVAQNLTNNSSVYRGTKSRQQAGKDTERKSRSVGFISTQRELWHPAIQKPRSQIRSPLILSTDLV